MEESVVRLDSKREFELSEKMYEYLNNDSCNVILDISEKFFKGLDEDIFNNADIVLPGVNMEENCLKEDEKLLDILCDNSEADARMMTLSNGLKSVENIMSSYSRLSTELEYCGNCSMKEESSVDMIINKINMVSPCIILCMADSIEDARWIIQNKTKMSAKLCIIIGGDTSEVLERKVSRGSIIAKLVRDRLIRCFL